MSDIRVNYKGKTYTDIGEYLNDAIHDKMPSLLTTWVEDKLKPFRAEIASHDGSVTIKIGAARRTGKQA